MKYGNFLRQWMRDCLQARAAPCRDEAHEDAAGSLEACAAVVGQGREPCLAMRRLPDRERVIIEMPNGTILATSLMGQVITSADDGASRAFSVMQCRITGCVALQWGSGLSTQCGADSQHTLPAVTRQ